jgi:hypothetical protein
MIERNCMCSTYSILFYFVGQLNNRNYSYLAKQRKQQARKSGEDNEDGSEEDKYRDRAAERRRLEQANEVEAEYVECASKKKKLTVVFYHFKTCQFSIEKLILINFQLLNLNFLVEMLNILI